MALAYLKSYGVIDNPRTGTWVLTQVGKAREEVDGTEVSRAYRSKGSPLSDIDQDEVYADVLREIPIDDRDIDSVDVEDRKPRESLEIQALVARIGADMGMDIWVPPGDRTRIAAAGVNQDVAYLDALPLNYGLEPLKTIEQIDVIWIHGSYIERAFEIEHTTAIYSGLLRMADLMALIPNMIVKTHIVAPQYRREHVFREIKRPTFRHLPSGPLSNFCTFISYDRIRELSDNRDLKYIQPLALDSYSEKVA